MARRIDPTPPHYIHGYAGHSPQYKLIQESLGKPHRLWIDPSINNFVAPKSVAEYQANKLTFTEIDYVIAHSRDPDYKHPTEPGPQCFLPFLNTRIGAKKLFSTIAKRVRELGDEKCHNGLVQRVHALKDVNNKLLTLATRSECNQRSKKSKDVMQKLDVRVDDKDSSDTVEKPKLICDEIETPNKKFERNRQPVFDVYKKNSGLIPKYAGHVPGAIFRFGSTYGSDSFNAKKSLKGNLNQ